MFLKDEPPVVLRNTSCRIVNTCGKGNCAGHIRYSICESVGICPLEIADIDAEKRLIIIYGMRCTLVLNILATVCSTFKNPARTDHQCNYAVCCGCFDYITHWILLILSFSLTSSQHRYVNVLKLDHISSTATNTIVKYCSCELTFNMAIPCVSLNVSDRIWKSIITQTIYVVSAFPFSIPSTYEFLSARTFSQNVMISPTWQKENMISEIGALVSTKSGVLSTKKVHVSATKQRSSMHESATQRQHVQPHVHTETQIQQQIRPRNNTCSHVYTQRHKFSSRYDQETTRAATCTHRDTNSAADTTRNNTCSHVYTQRHKFSSRYDQETTHAATCTHRDTISAADTTKKQHVQPRVQTETQIQQQIRPRDNTCSHMYTQRHKFSSRYDQETTRAATCTHRDTNSAADTTKKQHVQPRVHTETQIQQQIRPRDNTCSHMYTQRHKFSSRYDQETTRAATCTHRDTNSAADTTKRQHMQPHVHTETQFQQQIRPRNNTCSHVYKQRHKFSSRYDQETTRAATCTHRDTNSAADTTKRQHVQPHVHTKTQIQQQIRPRDNTCSRRYNTICGKITGIQRKRVD